MNCQLCQKESDAYREGRLSDDMRNQVEAHLLSCEDCSASYYLQTLAEKVINLEKLLDPDQYLTARIMERIERPELTAYRIPLAVTGFLRPALIVTSMAAAIFVGILIGNIYKPSVRVLSIPVELALMDDGAIESVNIFSNE